MLTSELVRCWYVAEDAIEETEGSPALDQPYWVCRDRLGSYYCKLGEDLFLSQEEARAQLLKRLCAERDRIMGAIEALDADPV